MTDLSKRKAASREELKKIRAAIPPEHREAGSTAIRERLLGLKEIRSARAIFLFISYGSEVDTHALLDHFLESGKDLAVPRIMGSSEMIATPFTGWDDLVKGQLGILTPRGDQSYPGQLDVAITPGLGFTRTGHRIGYGRGYYDKWFAKHPATRRVAIAYSEQILDEIPVDEKDVLMDRIVTEDEVITCADQ
ncbi:MAG TPA: 5-formyltetrahydrofolate cyclo-ligase [Gammaproteobacteria bacterium]|nr:5-formyltetrahydrofolate cyclo-ligase [Gammaproteobacteria bacterium]